MDVWQKPVTVGENIDQWDTRWWLGNARFTAHTLGGMNSEVHVPAWWLIITGSDG
ncbi:hypothetical protein F3Y22_tig00109971pilonHSYRG00009 [Hibiscus syriacus]|uniref:Uncharacterized protein n=1 Tax=Hibiscus syriacus TaxID=106335 RepID=A0A6A3BWI1_HIBSY|nr:hypothetical protein F3Y22_tig00109971pilonHSYRG00009 [Hibiscus syriacus]